MTHLQYMPGDPRLVDQLVYELKSKGIFDQFRKDCIADVDTRPAYQNLRQRVESSVSTFLSRQCWKPDLNKNQLREKLRKHILDGNYLEQGVERIVDQVVNPKVASVFIPQVEDLVYNYLGITRKKAPVTENTEKPEDLLPTELEPVSPGSVKSNDDKNEIEEDKLEKMETNQDEKLNIKEDKPNDLEKKDIEMMEIIISSSDSQESIDKSSIPLPSEEIKLENIPEPENSPPEAPKVELKNIALPQEPNLSTDIPLPDEVLKTELKTEKDPFFKPIVSHSDDSNSSSNSSLRRNMSPLTPIRNYNNENSCDAQQGFENDSDDKSQDKKEPSSFRFAIEANDEKSKDVVDKKTEKETTQAELSYQFTNQININQFNTPMYDESSNSNNLQIDYESDVNSKMNIDTKPEIENSEDSKKERKSDDRKSSHKSSHRSRDSSRHSSSKDKRSDSKHSTSRDSSRHDKKSSSKDDRGKSKSSKEQDKYKDRSDKKDSRDSSKHRSSHKSSSKDKDTKSHRSSSSSHRHSNKSSDERKSSSSKDKEKESSKDKSSKDKDRSKDSKSSSHRGDKDRKSSSSKKSDDKDKDKKKDKKDIDDHYSSSGRGNHGRRSTDRDSNDGSSSSKGSQNQNGSMKSSDTKKESKSSSSKSETTSTSGDSASPSDKEHIVQDNSKISQFKPVVRVENHLETPLANPPRLPFVPDVTLKKPRFAANLEEAKRLMKMRKFLDEEQKRMNQEAALLLEFQANVRPSLSQVYSSIPGPELEFACVSNTRAYEIVNVAENTPESVTTDLEVAEIIGKVPTDNLERSIIEIVGDTSNHVGDTTEVIAKVIVESDENIDDGESITEGALETETVSTETSQEDLSYDENKPFSELMEEISEKSKTENEEEDSVENNEVIEETSKENSGPIDENKNRTEYFEVTIITEELSETEDIEEIIKNDEVIKNDENISQNVEAIIKSEEEINKSVLVTIKDNSEIIKNDLETVKIDRETDNNETDIIKNEDTATHFAKTKLQYFAEHEKYNAELERQEFNTFLKTYIESTTSSKKMFLINCDTYEENIMKETASKFGDFEIVNYYKNGHLKLPNTSKNVVKNFTVSDEITLPVKSNDEAKSPLFSPVKSECSFELSSDYDIKLDDINKKSRQEVLEIILGGMIDESPSKMPTIDYYTECNIEETDNSLKRKMEEVDSSENNNRMVLTQNKIRKLSESDQISSTTEEGEEVSNNNKAPVSARSKYLGRARRVGLPRPKRCNLANSPSSDKSVENYVQNTPAPPATPNGKIKTTPRTKVQRYDTSDLYKPKLHYLSRRNNIS